MCDDAVVACAGCANGSFGHGESARGVAPHHRFTPNFSLAPLPIGLNTLFIVVRDTTQLLGVVVDEIYRVEYVATKQLQQTGGWGKYIRGMLSNPDGVVQFIAVDALMERYTGTLTKVEVTNGNHAS